MPTLPWTTPRRRTLPTGELTVMASRFQLQSWRDVPSFLLAALKIRRQMLGSSGIVGMSLIAKPIAKTFYTLSAWDDSDALNRAVRQQPHLDTMQRFRTRTEESLFAFWTLSSAQPRPGWDDAHHRLDQESDLRFEERTQEGQSW
jgi:hypothetical protein